MGGMEGERLPADGTTVETTWFGTASTSWANHHSDSWVSTTPLSGMPGDSTWSYAETRSDATTSTTSPCASRTDLPAPVSSGT